MRAFIRLAIALVALAGCFSPALAADNYVVKDATGANVTIRSKDTGAGVQATTHTVADTTGARIDPSTKQNQDTANTKLDAIIAALAAATPAGEAHIGEVGGNQLAIQVAQTVTASSAYTSGNAVGGLMTLSNAARVSGGSGLVQSVVINAKSAQTAPVDVFIFGANPSGSTCTDKTAFAVAAADFDKVLGVVHLADWTSAGTPSVGQAQNLAIPYALASGTSLYACAVVRGAPTFASTSDISVGVRVIRN